MTLFMAFRARSIWQDTVVYPQPPYRDSVFRGQGGVPIFGWTAIPDVNQDSSPRGTIIGTYGITGTLEDQWFLQILGRKAFARGYAVVLFDWRAHGKTAERSPTLTSDGLHEGYDFVQIAAQAKATGCPPPFWFTGFSLGGQLALWGIKVAQELNVHSSSGLSDGLLATDIGGGAAICPNLDSNRSLAYLLRDPLGRYLERAIAKQLKSLASKIAEMHPGSLDPGAIARANSIQGFDRELVISKLGFLSTEEYYQASSPLPFLPYLRKPTLILYAADDPMFDPSIIPDLEAACRDHPVVDLLLTRHGGHVGYYSSPMGQHQARDPDRWWAWNRILDWCDRATTVTQEAYAKN
jgi:predicted alpha/beta-fold hydrolase